MAEVQSNQISKLRQALTDANNDLAITDIYLAISSLGGLVTEGLSISSLIRSLPKTVTTHNIGQIDSVANVIFSSGKKRLTNQTATFMFHGVSQNLPAVSLSENQLFDLHKNTVRLRESIAENISTYTGVELEIITTLMSSGDTILKAPEAVAKGICDSIGNFTIPQGSKFISIGNV